MTKTAWLVGLALAGGGALTWMGTPEREVNLTAVGELWADVFRDADGFGLQLTRLPVAQEVTLGQNLALNVLATSVGAGDAARQERVRRVGAKLARQVRRKEIPYEFHLLEDPMVNAFALPGGQIFICTGLLDLLASDDELAGVLGHEIAHVDGRHVVERYQYEMRLRRFGLGDLSMLAQLPQRVVQAGYAQYQEIEADQAGMRLAVRGGFRADGAVNALRALLPPGEQANGRRDPKRPLEELVGLGEEALRDYFRSHPPTRERMRRLEASASTIR